MIRTVCYLLAGLLSVLLIAPAPPAAAQAAPAQEDWTLTRLREGNSLIASAQFDNGITVAARCSGNAFALILTGLPEVDRSETSRPLILVVGDRDEKPYTWTVASDRTVAFSRVPAILARQLIPGGRLQIIVPGKEGGRRTRYVMNLRPSESALQQTLAHCGRPLEDPRDGLLIGDAKGLPGGITWTRMPLPDFPAATVHGSIEGGSVTLSCRVETGGRLTDCQVEDEFPVGHNLGLAVRRSLDAARVAQTEEARAAGAPFEGGLIVFTVLFATPGD